ncbi:hypothetical protein LCGC14_0342250 [marine sediment metagenome]|uniref:Uncharacterized protein n=1 Tax=marine sediment metagenome TaxID=412755 RepID=A0A0F9WL08_9ZZZZ
MKTSIMGIKELLHYNDFEAFMFNKVEKHYQQMMLILGEYNNEATAEFKVAKNTLYVWNIDEYPHELS